jgi:hypothetical protein
MDHNVLLVFSTKPFVLGLYIVVYLCFIARHVNKFFTTSLKNQGLLLETILSGVPNQVNIHSYKNHVIYYFGEDFKAHIFTNFVM